MLLVLADPLQARAMGRRARERVEAHFTIQSTAARTEALYQELLA